MKLNTILNEVNTKLTRLGRSLFYLYITFVMAGYAGIVYGVTALILKLFHVDAFVATRWWETLALILISWFVAKTFRQESYKLIDLDKPPKQMNVVVLPKNSNHIEQFESTNDSNVIPFVRKSH